VNSKHHGIPQPMNPIDSTSVSLRSKTGLRRQVCFLIVAMIGPRLTMKGLRSIGVRLSLFVKLFGAFIGAVNLITTSENEKVGGTVPSQQSLFS